MSAEEVFIKRLREVLCSKNRINKGVILAGISMVVAEMKLATTYITNLEIAERVGFDTGQRIYVSSHLNIEVIEIQGFLIHFDIPHISFNTNKHHLLKLLDILILCKKKTEEQLRVFVHKYSKLIGALDKFERKKVAYLACQYPHIVRAILSFIFSLIHETELSTVVVRSLNPPTYRKYCRKFHFLIEAFEKESILSAN